MLILRDRTLEEHNLNIDMFDESSYRRIYIPSVPRNSTFYWDSGESGYINVFVDRDVETTLKLVLTHDDTNSVTSFVCFHYFMSDVDILGTLDVSIEEAYMSLHNFSYNSRRVVMMQAISCKKTPIHIIEYMFEHFFDEIVYEWANTNRFRDRILEKTILSIIERGGSVDLKSLEEYYMYAINPSKKFILACERMFNLPKRPKLLWVTDHKHKKWIISVAATTIATLSFLSVYCIM